MKINPRRGAGGGGVLQAGLALHQGTSVAADEIRGFICVAIKQRNTAANDNERHSTA